VTDRDEFLAAFPVSRETLAKLDQYAALLQKWQKTINLVSASTLPQLWVRHFLDSAQLFPLIPASAKTVLDFGSGAGFPALVLAILGVPQIHLVESDARKCAFLRVVAVECGLSNVTVHNQRIEAVQLPPVDVMTARALAPVQKLLDWGRPFAHAETLALFPKSPDVDRELAELTGYSSIAVSRTPSLTQPGSFILKISGFSV
jgi:16S rRNA (guanine527-N7)-methyltransferase